ncbi:MAG: TRAP transporter fused permease subunit [Rhodospirillaceae bacterium]|jgi:TRAP transporter 4TM/12TM fusion protein|nr:TRAP transporter fused permease subunit [Rhodospirillaceae bacterium]MBT5455219.1 TRAP transporter fused permease subunit [Rhodospirillaceae bacterium]
MAGEPISQEPPRPAPFRLSVHLLSAVITILALIWAVDLHVRMGFLLYTEQALAAILGMSFLVIFLTIPARKQGPIAPWYDVIASLLGAVACAMVAVRFPVISEEGVFLHPVETAVAGVVIVPLMLESLRRTAGPSLVVIVLAFLAYGLFGHLVPGRLEGKSKEFFDLAAYLAYDTAALFGLSMRVVCLVVILFIFLGQMLLRTGGSEWFTDLAAALMGRTRGGAAKVSVVASGLFGTISGSAVSNVASTGVITIPLMTEAGFSPRVAGAIEAVASTGGQIMPPIMGAAGFLMAEFLDVPYTDVLLAALIPAILFYVAVFIQVDLEAARNNIPRIPEDRIPAIALVLKEGWQFILPFVVLLVLLFQFNRTPEESALAAALSIILVSVTIGYKGRRLDLKGLWQAICATGESSVGIVIIGAMAGTIIGILDGTGLGFGMTYVLVQFGEGNLLGLLAITALTCIVLGMGMPTAGIYLLLATLAAPPLIKLGVPPMSAHLFVLYFGIMSMITPPVALCAFTAANLSGANPMETGVTAVRLGWTAFVVPFLFVFAPTLIMEGGAGQVILATVTAIAGVWLASAGMLGYFARPLGWAMRMIFLIAGLALLIPAEAFTGALYLDAAGAALGALAAGRELLAHRATRAAGL